MNNQFFSDERDFCKYGILRMLSNAGKRPIGVCWLLTNDCKNGGGKPAYFKKPKNNEINKDKELFGFLQRNVCVKQQRDVALLEKENIIEGAAYFNDVFSDNEVQRKEYFNKMQKQFSKKELVFFDPDTGIKYYSRHNSKNPINEYIEPLEIKDIFSTLSNYSLMIFQYFNFPLYGKNGAIQQQIDKSHKIWQKLSYISKEGKASIHMIFRKPVAYYFIIRKNHSQLIKDIEKAAEHFCFDDWKPTTS